MWFWLGVILVIVATFILPAFYIVPQWEKVAVIRFGQIEKISDTGLHLRIPVIDSLLRVDIRTQTLDMMGQQAITKDNISVIIDAVVFMVHPLSFARRQHQARWISMSLEDKDGNVGREEGEGVVTINHEVLGKCAGLATVDGQFACIPEIYP